MESRGLGGVGGVGGLGGVGGVGGVGGGVRGPALALLLLVSGSGAIRSCS